MDSFRAREAVATTARNAPLRSSATKARSSSEILPSRAQPCTISLARKAITRTSAPVSTSPPIFGSPTFPAPTTRQRLPSSFKNIGNKLLIVPSKIRLNLPPHSAHGPGANHAPPLPQTHQPESSAVQHQDAAQKSTEDFRWARHRQDTSSTDAR